MATTAPPKSVFAGDGDEIFETIDVEIEFLDRLVGGAPKDPKLVQGWLRKGMGVTDEEELRLRTREHLLEMVGEDEEARKRIEEAVTFEDLVAASESLAAQIQTQGFKRDEGGDPYIEARHIKAGIKESVNILFAGDGWGQSNRKGPKSFTAERVFVSPGRIPVGDDSDVQVDLAVGHISGPRGPQSTIGYYEYVERKRIAFTIEQLIGQNRRELGEPAIDREKWAKIWAHMERNGLGAMRSQGFGQFVVVRFDYRDGGRSA